MNAKVLLFSFHFRLQTFFKLNSHGLDEQGVYLFQNDIVPLLILPLYSPTGHCHEFDFYVIIIIIGLVG